VQRTDIYWVGIEATCMHMAHVALEVAGSFFFGVVFLHCVCWLVCGLTFLTLPPPPHLQTI